MSKSDVNGSFFHEFECNGITYEIYANQSSTYNIYKEIEEFNGSGYYQGNLVFGDIKLGPGWIDRREDDIKAYLESYVCCDKNTGTGCNILGGKLRKTKRSSRSRKKRRMKKTRRRRGKK
jgi:hypothetical protein